MGAPDLIVVGILGGLAALLIGGAIQVFIIRLALTEIREDLARVADRIAPYSGK